MRWLALLVMAFALAGCGGGDEESAASEDTTIEETLTEETTQDSGTDTDGSVDYCQALLSARVSISAAFLGAGSVSQEDLDELARNAPEEIRADVETLAQALATYTEKVGDDPTVFEREAALASLNPEMDAAEERLDAWEQENCTG